MWFGGCQWSLKWQEAVHILLSFSLWLCAKAFDILSWEIALTRMQQRPIQWKISIQVMIWSPKPCQWTKNKTTFRAQHTWKKIKPYLFSRLDCLYNARGTCYIFGLKKVNCSPTSCILMRYFLNYDMVIPCIFGSKGRFLAWILQPAEAFQRMTTDDKND